ncbi:MAG: efflux transporter [Candidatus Brocadia fulgida]|uniref:Efflux transporter n=1 Tax=Candidatus Brocadia fulgida TaxID=380242 RepID=A0A0M2UYQ9_9BACT|nr:MAG: efflux transporter [Candidatus Brocadia fulgida]
MNMQLISKPRIQRSMCICFILIVGVSAFLSNFRFMAFGKDSPATVADEKYQVSSKKISLEDAIRIAVEKNPQLQSTRDQIDAAIGELRQSRLYPNPVLELLAEEIPDNEIGLNQSQNLVAVTQPIITGGKRGLGIKVSEKSKEKNEFERDTVLLEVMANTKKAFYKVVGDQEGLVIARKVEEIAKGIYASEKLRFEAGEVAITNVLRAEVELSMAKNSVFHAEGVLQNSIKELQTVMGIPEDVIDGVTGNLLSKPGALALHELELQMSDNQPSLKASKKNIEVADTQLMLEKRQVIPDITVSAGYKRLSAENIDTVQLGVEIPAPFFNRNQGNIQKGKALAKKAKSENLSVYNELLFQLRRNFNSFNIERKRVMEYREKILPKADEALTLITRGYREGEFDYIDLLDAQRTWAETRISYVESLKNLNLIIADIERLAVTKIREQ